MKQSSELKLLKSGGYIYKEFGNVETLLNVLKYKAPKGKIKKMPS